MTSINSMIKVHEAPIIFTITHDAQYKVLKTVTSLDALPAPALTLTFGETLVAVTNIVNFLKKISHLLLVKHFFHKENEQTFKIIVDGSGSLYNKILSNNDYSKKLSLIEIQLLISNVTKLLNHVMLKESTCNSIASNVTVCYATLAIIKPLLSSSESVNKYPLFAAMSECPSLETEKILIRAIESESPNSNSMSLLVGFKHLKGQDVERKLLSFFSLTQDINLRERILFLAANNGFELQEWLDLFRQQLNSDEQNFKLPYGSIRPLLNSGIHIERIIQYYQLREYWGIEDIVSLSIYCAANNIKSSSLLSTEDVLNINIRNIYTDYRYETGAFAQIKDIYPESSHWDIVRSFINHELEFIRTKGFRILSSLVKEKTDFSFARLDDGQYIRVWGNIKQDLKIPDDIYRAAKQACGTLMKDAVPASYVVLLSIAQLDHYSLDAVLFVIDKVNSSKNIQAKNTMAGYALHEFSQISQKNLLRNFIIDHLEDVEQPDIPFFDSFPRTKDPHLINCFMEKHQKADSEQKTHLLEQGLLAIAESQTSFL